MGGFFILKNNTPVAKARTGIWGGFYLKQQSLLNLEAGEISTCSMILDYFGRYEDSRNGR